MLLCQNRRLFTVAGDKVVRRFSRRRPAVLNTLSLAAEDAGTHSTWRATYFKQACSCITSVTKKRRNGKSIGNTASVLMTRCCLGWHYMLSAASHSYQPRLLITDARKVLATPCRRRNHARNKGDN